MAHGLGAGASSAWLTGIVALAISILTATQNAAAWWTEGHAIVARASAVALPDDVPIFFRQSGEALAYFSAEADLWKNPATPHLRNAEWPEHFLDYELLKGRSLPPLRWQYAALCAEMRRSPHEVGLLPYAIVEWTERLTLAFAEYRRRPSSPHAREKCLVYGGLLSHYAADLAQPLHLTVDYDGRTSPGAPSPRTGIHDRMDALIQAAGIRPPQVARMVNPIAFEDPFTSTVQHLIQTRRRIDTVYALELDLPALRRGNGVEPDWKPSERIREFALDRAGAASFLVAGYWLTAWTRSETLDAHVPLHTLKVEQEAAGRANPVVWVGIILAGLGLALLVVHICKRVAAGQQVDPVARR